jgi:hypothetical protein
VSGSEPYPTWKFYPSRTPAPDWVPPVLEAFSAAAERISSASRTGVSSDAVLAAIRPSLVAIGFEVEASKAKTDRITRPVLFGENGTVLVQYDVDAYHPGHRLVLEVEAGRGAASNADYRDLVRASLMVDVDYLVLAMMLTYTGGGQPVRSYETTRSRIDAIFASKRLALPLKGVLLLGY